MSYLVLARKYRPQDFSSVTGQEHVTRTLSNAIARGRISHAYLFAGPRGVGKTSIARIFSKALNCEKGPTAKPCLKCVNCVEIAQGNSMAVREIDGASHNSVENVRELIDSFRSLPSPGSRYKIYIIDEVHMLSTAAFNALLKSLEEPPPHTVFMLATTEAHKIPETVLSRCQRHDLRAIANHDIEARLAEVCKSEKVEIDPEALRMIARYSDGSMRDSQSILDRVHAFCDGKISAAEVGVMLGSVERKILFELSASIFAHDSQRALEILANAFKGGLDIGLFLRELVVHFRELLIARFGAENSLAKMGLAPDDVTELKRQASTPSSEDLQDLVQLVREGADMALRSTYPKYALEALVVRLALRESVKDLATLIQELGQGEQGPGVGGAVRSAQAPRVATAAASNASRSNSVASPTAAVAKTKSKSENLDWGSFVRFVSDKKGKMMGEQLKRFGITNFSDGELVAHGPAFCVQYFSGEPNKENLKQALSEFSGIPTWVVHLTGAEGQIDPAPGSLAHEEKAIFHREKEAQQYSVEDHPTLKNLQKVFPGSKIDNIVTKE